MNQNGLLGGNLEVDVTVDAKSLVIFGVAVFVAVITGVFIGVRAAS